MRKRNRFIVTDKVSIKRSVSTGGGVHVYREGDYIGFVERWRMRGRDGNMMTVWLPVTNADNSHKAPTTGLREAVERVVRAHEIRANGYTIFTAQKGSK